MQFIRYISVFLILSCFWSCSYLEFGQDVAAGEDGLVQIVPRVLPFGEMDTKANKTPEEQKITSLAVAVFNQDGTCIYYGYDSGNGSFLLDPDNLADSYTGLNSCSVYAFANIPALAGWEENEAWKSRTAEDFLSVPVEVEGVGIPKDGFPMMGVKEGVNLDPSGTVDYLISVEMICAYAKITVSMSVNSELDLPSGNSSYFFPERWEVHNVPSAVDFVADVETSPDVLPETFQSTSFTGSQATSSSKVSFTLYLPERLLEPDNHPYEYPFVTANGGTLRDEDKNLRQRYKPDLVSASQQATYISIYGMFSDHQGHRKNIRYDLYVGENNYDDFNVRRNVQYSNNVTIRSAKKNSGDPDATDEEQLEFENTISYDGRVEFEESDYMVRIERETLLDAHWEVRPLRISVMAGSVKVSIADAVAKPWIRMENTSDVPSGSDDHILSNGNTYGKRKYFTVDLHDSPSTSAPDDGILSGNIEYILSQGDHCIWLYVDEYVNTANVSLGGRSIPSGADNIRSAVINISHYDSEDASGAATESADFTIAQRQLYPVRYSNPDTSRDTIYNIEYHEEYLHNYDSYDGFCLTEYEGMPWGLSENGGVQLSYQHRAAYMDETGGLANLLGYIGVDVEGLLNGDIASASPYYDFYLPRDDSYSGTKVRQYRGYDYSHDIIYKVGLNDKTLLLSESPSSAVEYCYNRNKRRSDGTIAEEDIHWYLPAIDEIEEITMGGYGTFDDFQNKFYWSSQPSYEIWDLKYSYQINIFGWRELASGTGEFMVDDVSNARATKIHYDGRSYNNVDSGVKSTGDDKFFGVGYFENRGSITYTPTRYETEPELEEGNHPRTKQNRVRCVYKAR